MIKIQRSFLNFIYFGNFIKKTLKDQWYILNLSTHYPACFSLDKLPLICLRETSFSLRTPEADALACGLDVIDAPSLLARRDNIKPSFLTTKENIQWKPHMN